MPARCSFKLIAAQHTNCDIVWLGQQSTIPTKHSHDRLVTSPTLFGNDPAEAPAPGTRFVDVVVNSGQPARTPFTYSVPDGMAVAPGQAVFVPFGPRILQGLVVAEAETTSLQAVRPIASIADPDPVLDGAHIELARWISAEYLAPLWDCLACCLPSGYGQKAVTMVSPVDIPPLLPIYPKD